MNQKSANDKTKMQAIIHFIKKLIRKHKIAELKKFKGTVDLELDLDAARDRNENYSSFSGGDHEISES